ncbi:MAG TPA: hypothetical protein VFY61_14410 [Pyrinomonadaceae bacterium]|nr:hypothetical protein [Pyrinomonadaceae bacterium]
MRNVLYESVARRCFENPRSLSMETGCSSLTLVRGMLRTAEHGLEPGGFIKET